MPMIYLCAHVGNVLLQSFDSDSHGYFAKLADSGLIRRKSASEAECKVQGTFSYQYAPS